MDSVDEGYRNLWGIRRSPPVVTENWVDNEWAKGRTDYLTFLIRVDDQDIRRRVAEVQESFRRFSCADCFPPEYLHVTVKEVGGFLVDEKSSDDEFIEGDLEKLVQTAGKALENMKGFEIEFRQVNHFRSNIVIEAHENGEVREMNRRLMKLDGVKTMGYDYPKFLPHMSICQFQSTDDYDGFIDHLETKRKTNLGRIQVKQVDLVKAILPKTGRYPVLEPLTSFKLA